MMTDARRIWRMLEEANRAWLDGRPRDVAFLYHSDAVVQAGERRTLGREAIVQSYVDYCALAVTHSFEMNTRTLDLFGETAVLSYHFVVSYSLDGSRFDERGEETLVFQRRDAQWGVVWRQQRSA
ncbi:MAG: nuclear transport factor 2 family protein [Myxococcota bacterium]|jgi:uncharacterized protein (TIGR02246 family)|nr:nuclear transport factor 2 family protein [Myxococcota bacterium]